MIFSTELKCLRSLSGRFHGRWLEVGVGTGRFAANLGATEGIDVSPRMLSIAAGRGIKVCEGRAEALPFPDRSFDGILMVLTLCFVAYPMQAIRECRRVLRSEGRLLLGIVPADSPLGAVNTWRKLPSDIPCMPRGAFSDGNGDRGAGRSGRFRTS